MEAIATQDVSDEIHGIPRLVFERRWLILAVLCTSLVIVIVGNTALNVALPTMARELGASTSQLQWMVDAYSLVFAGCLLTAGAIGDRYGRKGALQVGLGVFLAGSLFAALVHNAGAVIGGRAVMGLGAAFVMPATLSILTNVFPAHERTKAIAIWAGISGGGAAIGPIASGFLLEHFSWGAVFFVNVPIIAAALVVGHFLLPTSRDPKHDRLDPLGAVLSIAGLGALVYAIIEAPHHGWASAESAMWFGAAALILGTFLWWEHRNPYPMLNLSFFKDPRFSVAAGGITLVFFAMFGLFFILTQYFQLVLGYSALEAGLKQGPIAIVMILLAPQTPRLAVRFGANRVVAGGLGVVALSLVLFFAVTGSSTSYPVLLVPMATMAAGMALTMSPLTASIMAAVPLGKAGVGSATNDTTRELGGALGVAVLGSLVASQYQSQLSSVVRALPAALRSQAQESLASALRVAGQLGASGDSIAAGARDAYVSGMHLAAAVGAVVAAIASVIVYKLLPAAVPGHVPAAKAVETQATHEGRVGHGAPVFAGADEA
jgi:EmrB/QacA subfamily drug resistance transporter